MTHLNIFVVRLDMLTLPIARYILLCVLIQKKGNMAKEKYRDEDFMEYQEYLIKEFKEIIHRGWNDFHFPMPPEFIIPLILYNVIMESNLSDDIKSGWIEGNKYFWKERDIKDLNPRWGETLH